MFGMLGFMVQGGGRFGKGAEVAVCLICVDITATAFCHCPSFPRKRESREFVRYGLLQTGQADSRFRGNDGAENSLSTYVKNTEVALGIRG